MGKKRKQKSHSADAGTSKRDEQTKYNLNEECPDSEDEFYAQRDQILLGDGPLKKRRKVHEGCKHVPNSVWTHLIWTLKNPFNSPTKKY